MASENGELVNKSVVGLKYADFELFDNMPGMRMLYVLLPTRRLISFRHIAVERVLCRRNAIGFSAIRQWNIAEEASLLRRRSDDNVILC